MSAPRRFSWAARCLHPRRGRSFPRPAFSFVAFFRSVLPRRLRRGAPTGTLPSLHLRPTFTLPAPRIRVASSAYPPHLPKRTFEETPISPKIVRPSFAVSSLFPTFRVRSAFRPFFTAPISTQTVMLVHRSFAVIYLNDILHWRANTRTSRTYAHISFSASLPFAPRSLTVRPRSHLRRSSHFRGRGAIYFSFISINERIRTFAERGTNVREHRTNVRERLTDGH